MLNRILVIGIALAFSLVTNGQVAYRFRNFTINDGLSQSSINCIVQDNIGALWLGTQDGLNRFNGKDFEVFNSDDTPGLESQYFLCSDKDPSGTLWFGTTNGLTSYDPLTEKFHTYHIPGKTYLSVESLSITEQGDLWLATSTQGLAFFDHKTKKVSIVSLALPTKRLSFVKQLSEQTLLISSEDRGAFAYNIKTKLVSEVKPKQSAEDSWTIKDVDLFSGSVYMLATNRGLWLYDYENKTLLPFLPEIEKDFGIIELSSIYLKSKEEFYISTLTKGLLTVKKQGGVYSIFQNRQDFYQKNALLFDEINNLYVDKNEAIWIGTLRGLSCFNPKNEGFLGVGPSKNLNQGLPSESVWSFVEDENQDFVFIATDFTVSKVNRKTGVFTHFNFARGASNNESSILSIRYVKKGEILVGCTDGIYILSYNDVTYQYKKVDYKSIDNPSSFDRIYQILPYKNNTYFLATKGGVLLYDDSKKELRPFTHDPKKTNTTITAGVCRHAFKTSDGTVFFATSVGGLCVLTELKDGTLQISPYKWSKKLLSASKDYFTCSFQKAPNEIWLGTSGSGIIKLNTLTGKTQQISKEQGLPNNFIYGILPDNGNNLWISTNKGLCKYNLTSGSTTNFTEVNGLMSNEFNTGAYLRSKTGELFFGGITGYNFFNPEKLNKKQVELSVSFDQFKLDKNWLHPGEEGAPFQKAIYTISMLELGYNQRSFTLRFLPSDLMNPELLEYKYRLVGSDEEDVYLGTTNEIHFNSLAPGNYTLEVYVRRNGGNWTLNPAKMELEIAGPFWKKWWFILIVLAICGLAVRIFILSRINLARRDQVRLEMKIAERTREIRAQNEKIELQKKIIVEEKDKVENQKRLLQIEKDKSETLLRNMIPESTAEELKTKGRASARAYKTVSVLFTDFVGFTQIAESLKPTELVNKLDVYFRKFDEIIVQNNLEKIKTIGDAYMCAGGVPVRNNTNPIDAVLAAIQIQEYMTMLRNDAIANGTEYWELRLGINTGEVTAGVIGSERLAYDIWGATVNQAQRMEMMGEPGRVTISGATFKLVEPYFECTFRGKVQSKSKGLIDVFTVERIKPELSQNGEGLYPNERFQQIVNLHLYSSINYYKAERHIMKVLEKGLSAKLHYHSIAHTKDVVRAVERYALLEGVTDEGLFLLKSAATYHDAGFVESYEKNEPIGARMAEEILPKYGYSEKHIDQIKELIYVTQIPHQPKNKLEEIICDADLDYLGRDDFHEISDRLRRELREHGKISSDRQWDHMQVAFLNMHKYFTPTAKAGREKKKAQNLQDVMDRLERDEYID